jgi:membrane protein DedA with SNARE-associated domain
MAAWDVTVWLQTAKKAVSGSRHGGSVAAVHRSPILRWLLSLGWLGVFGVAILDSSMVPLPLPGSTDFLLLLLASNRGTSVTMEGLLAFSAFAGSLIGGYFCWSAGRKGGEVALARYVPKRALGRITRWVEGHGALPVAISAILPPPVPLTPFILVAGALKVPLRPFLLSYGIARAVRYSFLAWLGYAYGRRIVTAWEKELSGWSTVIITTYLILLTLGIAYAIWKIRRGGKVSTSQTDSPNSQSGTPAGDVA